MTSWNHTKDMSKKEKVTHDVVTMFPDCRGKRIFMMTSLSFTDLKEIISQDKIDGTTTIYNIDNLSSIKESTMERKKKKFTNDWNAVFSKLFEGKDKPKKNLLFGDILSTPLCINSDKQFKVVYADTCNIPTERLFHWIDCGATVKSIEDDGVFAFTITMNHINLSEYESDCIIDGSTTLQFDGIYNDAGTISRYASILNGIKRKIEGNGNWNVEKMIHYCEQDRCSQMITVICKKHMAMPV